MPLGLVKDDEFECELNRLKSVPLIQSSVKQENHGRNPGDVNVPSSLQKIIGETGVLDGRKEALQLASMFGVSSSSTSAYTNGATSTASYNKSNPGLKNHIQKSKDRIHRKARGVLNIALDSITEEKLLDAKVAEIATVAKSMSGIMKDMEPDRNDPMDSPNKPQIVIFAPMIRKEETYEVINAND